MNQNSTISSKLVLHHVGGRAGSICFPIPEKFETDIINVLYEADASCIEQIKTRWSQHRAQTEVYPYCLSDKVGHCEFHLNYDPYTSSIYSFNEKFKDYYYPYPGLGMDYVLGDSCQAVQTLTLDTTTLDTIIAEGKVVAPNFLSLDTQGSELNILKGAQKCLEDHVSALFIEVEFHSIYKNQPLFHDLCAFLNPLGFELVDLNLFERYPLRGKWGIRGEGLPTEGEALFFKAPEAIKSLSKGERALQLNKLAFIALMFNRFEYMQLCMNDPGFQKLENQNHYLQLISDIEQVLKQLPERPFPIFSDKFSVEASKARFENATSTPLENATSTPRSLKGRLRQIARKSKLLTRCWIFLRRSYYSIKIRKTVSSFEQLLIDNQLNHQYEVIVKNRIIDTLPPIYKKKV